VATQVKKYEGSSADLGNIRISATFYSQIHSVGQTTHRVDQKECPLYLKGKTHRGIGSVDP